MKITLEEEEDYFLLNGCFTYHSECIMALKDVYGAEVAHKLIQPIEKLMVLKNTYDSEMEGNPNFELESDNDLEQDVILLQGVCIVQAECLHFMATFAQHSPSHFIRYKEMCSTLVSDSISNIDRHIRQHAGGLCKMILTAMLKNTNNGMLPMYKKGLPADPINKECSEYFKGYILPTLTIQITSDTEPENARIFIEMLKDAVVESGPFVIQENSEAMVQIVEDILNFDLNCFDRGQEGEEDYESDGQIFIQVCDLVIEITKILKDSSKEFLEKIMSPMWKMVSSGGVLELEEFIGAFCDFIEHCPTILPSAKEHVCKMIFNSPHLQDDMACRNAAFCLGLMFETNPTVMADTIPQSLKFLEEVLTMFEDDAVRDNAVAGFCRVYIADNSNQVPLDQLIEKIKVRFPFKGDPEENKTITSFASILIQKDAARFNAHLDTFVKITLTNITRADEFKLED